MIRKIRKIKNIRNIRLRLVLFLLFVLLVLSSADVNAEYIEGREVEQTLAVGATITTKKVCNHVLISRYVNSHQKNKNGTCKMEIYKIQYCKICGYVNKNVLVDSSDFDKCTH